MSNVFLKFGSEILSCQYKCDYKKNKNILILEMVNEGEVGAKGKRFGGAEDHGAS